MSEGATFTPAPSIADRVASAAWSGIFDGGLSAVIEASKAVAAAVETKALSVDPHLVDSMIKKLTTMQDELTLIGERRSELSRDTKLGDGYAADVARNNTDFGRRAAQQLVDITKAIESLKTQIEKSRASYQNVDQAGSDSFKKLNGTS